MVKYGETFYGLILANYVRDFIPVGDFYISERFLIPVKALGFELGLLFSPMWQQLYGSFSKTLTDFLHILSQNDPCNLILFAYSAFSDTANHYLNNIDLLVLRGITVKILFASFGKSVYSWL